MGSGYQLIPAETVDEKQDDVAGRSERLGKPARTPPRTGEKATRDDPGDVRTRVVRENGRRCHGHIFADGSTTGALRPLIDLLR